MFDVPTRQAHSLIYENGDDKGTLDEKFQFRSQGARPVSLDTQQIGTVLNRSGDRGPVSRLSNEGARTGGPQAKDRQVSDMELMKERFAKLLLGEDMSGGGKGVSSALALSNAITNLAASVFGEQWKLEPMSAERKLRWRKEVDWLLSVTDYIVELLPSQQKSKDGTNMEIMVTQQRRDLLMNIPALRKLDAMLIDCLDNFKEHNEFWYVSRDADESEKGVQRNDKWWLPTVKVPANGLSDASRKWLQYQKECVNQVLKASLAINAQILSEMEVPENYIDSLPKFLSTLDLSSEHKVLDLKNRIEASIVIWRRKMNHKDGKSTWGSAVSLEKRELFEERAETILLLLKQRFPGLPQSSLDISKIQYNRDVGHSVLESYSRVLESLANTVTSRIEDVLYADSLTQDPSLPASRKKHSMDSSPLASPPPGSLLSAMEETEKLNSPETPSSMTLSDFMGWNLDQGETDMRKNLSTNNVNISSQDENEKTNSKPANIVTHKKFSYIEKLENCLRSPTARH
ncbi:unnamed protein product [Ilex paraguariensis]|uniref:PRONE domain-containing protein n=1 Tax=Ilex paraguariensis TaxID=185542 RepID=A0ABC8TY79_9AQUA